MLHVLTHSFPPRRSSDLFGERFADAILDEVERRVAPSLRANLVTRLHYTPADFGRDLSAHLGSAFSLEPVLWQSAWFRAHTRDDVISNLYFVGAGQHPGAGNPGEVGRAACRERGCREGEVSVGAGYLK